jgi:uncharacterized protein YcbX
LLTVDTRAALVASRPAATAYARTLTQLPPSLVGAEGRLAQIAIYPVKGLGALQLACARVDARGLVDPATGLADRGVMLAYRKPGATADGVAFDAIALSNRTEASFALTRATFIDGALVYAAPKLAALHLAPATLAPRGGEKIRVRLGFDGAPVLDGVAVEGPLAAWARELLRAHPARRQFAIEDVVAIHPTSSYHREVADKHRAGQEAETLFGDGAHALVASASTLDWMNAELAEAGARRIAMEPFRPNLVLEGFPPNAEDIILEAHVLGSGASTSVLFATMCIRCDATRVDYATGTRPDAQPLAWLARNRPPRDNDANTATFAMNAVFPASARGRVLHVGDMVRVASER